MEKRIMSDVSELTTLVEDLNTETNDIATKQDAMIKEIADLKAQIASGVPVTQEQLDAVVAGLTPISARLKGLGATATDPIPGRSKKATKSIHKP
jgi:hypothetical protein